MFAMILLSKLNLDAHFPLGRSLRVAAGLLVIAAATLAAAQDNGDIQGVHEFRSRVIHAADLYKRGDIDRSLVDFQKLYDENPRDANVEGWLGFLLLVKGRGADAVQMLEDASRQRPNDLEVSDNLGNAYYAAGMYDKALATYQQVVGEDGSMFVPHYNSGNIYLKREDYVHALVEYRRAAALKSDDPAVQNDLGICYERLKDDRNAAMCFMKASDPVKRLATLREPTRPILPSESQWAMLTPDLATDLMLSNLTKRCETRWVKTPLSGSISAS
jgi:Flp pilus assembly protein TadD